MRDAYRKWLIFEGRDDTDTLWVAFQAGWKFRDQQTARTPGAGRTREGNSQSILDTLANGTMEIE